MDNRKQITLLVGNGTQKKTYNVMEYKNKRMIIEIRQLFENSDKFEWKAIK